MKVDADQLRTDPLLLIGDLDNVKVSVIVVYLKKNYIVNVNSHRIYIKASRYIQIRLLL